MINSRVAIFDEWWPIHIGDEVKDLVFNDVTNWARFLESPKVRANGDGSYIVDDQRAVDEIHRIGKFKTCPMCRNKMERLLGDYQDDLLFLCTTCGYWGGRGWREWGMHHELVPTRGVLSRYKPVDPLDAATTEYLVTHLRRFPQDMTKISPLRAEKFVVALLTDYLDCEVKALGGSKDKGIDGYILRGDKIRTLIQVKWHQDMNKAESVRVVREVAGTLTIRGIPDGIIVSNRIRFSPAAVVEAGLVSTRELNAVGKMSLSLYDYNRVIDMLEISNTKLTEDMSVSDWFRVSENICVFDGASSIGRSFVEQFFARGTTNKESKNVLNNFSSLSTTLVEEAKQTGVLEITQKVRLGDEKALMSLVRLKKIRLICERTIRWFQKSWPDQSLSFDDFFQEVIVDVCLQLFNQPEFKSEEEFFRWTAMIARDVLETPRLLKVLEDVDRSDMEKAFREWNFKESRARYAGTYLEGVI